MFKQEVEIFSIVLNILCWVHCYFYSGKKISKVFVFFGGAMFLGGITEAVSIILTGSYNYPGFRWYIGPVPIFIALGWGATFYITYHLANHLTKGFEKTRYYFLTYGLVAGLLGMAMDLNFDPVSVSLNWWDWKNGSPYFGVPIANFVGWFFFCCGFCMAYKIVESLSWKTWKKAILFFLLLIPVFIVTSLSAMPFLK
jgi:putative membrane protein